MTAFLIVRAEVEPSARDAFDAWYRNEHLPDAVEAFSAAGAWRGWSAVDDNVHIAFYEFENLAEVSRVMVSDALKRLIAEFERQGDPYPRSDRVDPGDLNRSVSPPSHFPP